MTAVVLVPVGLSVSYGIASMAVTLAAFVLLAYLGSFPAPTKRIAQGAAFASALALTAYAILPFTCGRLWWLLIECWY